MKNKVTIFTLIGLVCAGVLFLLFYFFSPEEKTDKKEKKTVERKPNDWERKDMTHKNIDPYGTFIFHQLLKHQDKKIRLLKRNSQYEKLDTINKNKRLYVFVGKSFDTHYKRINKILAFVGRGNDAFIAADIYPQVIVDAIQDHYKPHESYYKNVLLNFSDSLLKREKPYNFKFLYKRKNKYKRWTDFERQTNYYNSYVTTDSGSLIQSYEINETSYNPVFIKIPYGKGFLYLHSVPYTFTNVVMLNELGVHHAERVISCLPQRPIIFDSYINTHRQSNYGSSSRPPKIRTSPLQFILENRSLRWAYYILLAGLFFYIVFRGKRRQQIIPPKESIENTSIEFADTMSKLYLQYGQHKYIVFQQERNFINYIRNKYYMNVAQPDEDTIGRLAVKSGIDKQRINHLFERFNAVKKNNHAKDTDVVDIYAQIEYFYKNCK